SGDLAVVGGGADVEVDVAVDGVGDAAVGQLADHLRDTADDLGRGHFPARRSDAQRLHVGAEQVGLALGQGLPVDAGLLGAFQQRVVAVGGVLGVVAVVTGVAPHAAYEVEGEVGVRMAEMGGVV